MDIMTGEKVAEGPEGCSCACTCTCTCMCPTYPDAFTIGYHNLEAPRDTIYYEDLIWW